MRPSLIEEFCRTESDSLYGNVRKRRSVLIQIQKDMDYNFGVYKTFREIGLTGEQLTTLGNKVAPLFVVPVLFCSAVDLMARVKHKGVPRRSKNAAIFKDSAINFFGFSEEYADILWRFRNSITHQYSIKNFVISRSGSHDVIELHGANKERTVIFVRAMRSSLAVAIQRLEEYLGQESERDKERTKAFLEDHGFTYYLVV